MSNASLRALETYVGLTNTAAVSHLVRAALETGIVEQLRESQRTMEELATLTKIEERRLRLLVEALISIGIVERYDDLYALAQVGHLVPKELADLGDRYWRHLYEWVVDGKTIPSNDATVLDETDFLKERHASEWQQTPAAMQLADKLQIGNERKGLHILDIGCGSGVMSLTAAFRDPTCRVTAFDSPSELERTRVTIEGIDVDHRVELVENSNEAYDLPSGPFDMAILGNVAHLLNHDKVAEVISRAANVLQPNGEFVLVDVFAGQAKGNLTRALLDLQLALRYPQGGLLAQKSAEEMFVHAGLNRPTLEPLEAPPWIFGVMRSGLADSNGSSRD